jgi:hypothetical protein
MAKVIELFCEDRGHELFVRPLLARFLRERSLNAEIHVRSARGERERAVGEFRAWQSALGKGLVGVPDLLVLVIDGNCKGWNTARSDLKDVISDATFPRAVVACPDPHVERWCIADPDAFRRVVGGSSPPDPGKCEPNLYKDLLRRAIEGAGQPILIDEMEYAPDIVSQLDPYKAGKQQSSLGAFLHDLDAALKDLHRADRSF